MKKTILITITALLLCGNINAQIKIVGDDYSGQLTASKSYYDKDVDFEKLFPSFNDTVFDALYSHWTYYYDDRGYYIGCGYHSLNLTGDTVYLPIDAWIESVPSGTINNMRDKNGNFSGPKHIIDFCIDSSGEVQNRMMKKGYYEIVGYVFCSDNAEAVRKLNKLGQIELVNVQYLQWDKDATTKKLKDRILEDNIGNIVSYIQYIIFRSLEDDALYYLSYSNRFGFIGASVDQSNHSIIHSMMPLRFYNMAKTYIGEDVKIFKNSFSNNNLIGELVSDPVSERHVKIMDSVFTVKDIVMKNQSYYIILNGLNTGSFAFPFDFIFGTNTLVKKIGLPINLRGKYDVKYLLNYITEYRSEYYGLVRRKDLVMLKKRDKISQLQLEKEQKLKEQKRIQAQAKADAAFRQQMLTKHGDKFGKLVASKQVSLDMTKEMCRDAWGKPINTYRTTTKYGQSEVWCYNYKTRVYFYNGKVVQIDD